MVFEHLKTLNLQWFEVERLVQELAWRDFFQEVYKAKQDLIFSDLKKMQENVENWEIPKAIFVGNTGINIIDKGISELYTSGYIHNHLRMYIASITCNIAHSHWFNPAKWLYYNLLDGDLASNHLSWQWVAGSFSSKKYFANQENFNKYFEGNQKDTFMDVDYSTLPDLQIPEILKDVEVLNLQTMLPKIENPILNNEKTLVYNYYNLDFNWHLEDNFQRILLLETSHFKQFPVSEKCLDFALNLSENIPNIKIIISEFSDLNKIISKENIIYKEHPTNAHYLGIKEERETLTNIYGDFPSFFNFWKKIKKVLQKEFEN
ncbi:FAD-binding domain-containing protein [Frigoriflavimonas asaccharolytica]|uniref:Deoxyribodipyrimidine photo-lyase n=1 Tax=Frigoriflavimonas asaccharolytica TaxID=2735899 RepID=A0A8J8K7I7_9FLAO|nr:FAD-binding domain-containing protein [Frigoriflavimonas asaccharolytica]NRS91531.1 deoxyribodipyrimidine photo-lyase [Frigoriflavimonas asaccharolytica]